jgi:uncharacterized protein YgfB (UPF0149 family)
MRPTLKQLSIFAGIGIVSADIAGILSGALAGVSYRWSFLSVLSATVVGEWIIPAWRQLVTAIESMQDLTLVMMIAGYMFVLILWGAVGKENRTERSWL